MIDWWEIEGYPMDYKTIFIIDPTKSDRIHLAKFVKHEKFTVMTFTALADCFKRLDIINVDLIIYVLRRDKTEVQHLLTGVMDKNKNIPFIIVTPADAQEFNPLTLKEAGFTSVHKASSNEKVKEIVIELLAPEGLAPRTETPHPVPHNFVLTQPING